MVKRRKKHTEPATHRTTSATHARTRLSSFLEPYAMMEIRLEHARWQYRHRAASETEASGGKEPRREDGPECSAVRMMVAVVKGGRERERKWESDGKRVGNRGRKDGE